MVGISCTDPEPMWEDLSYLARIIPRVCHNVNRVCYIAGSPVVYQVLDITHTYLNVQVIDLLKEADHVINKVRNYILNISLLLQSPWVSGFIRMSN